MVVAAAVAVVSFALPSADMRVLCCTVHVFPAITAADMLTRVDFLPLGMVGWVLMLGHTYCRHLPEVVIWLSMTACCSTGGLRSAHLRHLSHCQPCAAVYPIP